MAIRYFIHLSYNGQNYRGWQIQKEQGNIQGKVEQCLSALFRKPMYTTACGRTDAGVHASQFFVHFETEEKIDWDFCFRMNKHLPEDICAFDLLEVPAKAHARFDAELRGYQYFLHAERIPNIADYSSYIPQQILYPERMAKAVELIRSTEDFLPFCKTPAKYDSTLCKISSVDLLINRHNDQYCFEITANRFLRGMIRNLMSRLISIGQGKLSLDHWTKLLSLEIDEVLPVPASPNGLHLTVVEYPFFNKEPRLHPKKLVLYRQDDEWRKITL